MGAGVLNIYKITNFKIRQFFFVGWALPTLLLGFVSNHMPLILPTYLEDLEDLRQAKQEEADQASICLEIVKERLGGKINN